MWFAECDRRDPVADEMSENMDGRGGGIVFTEHRKCMFFAGGCQPDTETRTNPGRVTVEFVELDPPPVQVFGGSVLEGSKLKALHYY